MRERRFWITLIVMGRPRTDIATIPTSKLRDGSARWLMENLNAAIEKRGHTDAEAAEMMGVSPDSVKAWRKGASAPAGQLQASATAIYIGLALGGQLARLILGRAT